MRNVQNPNLIADFSQFRNLVQRVNWQAANQAKDVQALLCAATAQCLGGNVNWVNELLKQDFRGMKREAMVAWLLTFAPVKVADRKAGRITSVRLSKGKDGWNSEHAKDKAGDGYNHPWHTFKTEQDGKDVADKFAAVVRYENFIKQLKANIQNVSATDLLTLAQEMRVHASNLETEANVKLITAN